MWSNNLQTEAAFMRNNPAPVIQASSDGKIKAYNPAALEILEKAVLEKSIYSALPGLEESLLPDYNLDELVQHQISVANRMFLFTVIKDKETDSLFFFGNDITVRNRIENSNKKLLHYANKRVKEFSGLYEIAKLANECTNLENLFKNTTVIIPSAFRFPNIIRSRVIYREKEYISEPFEQTQWKLKADIVVGGEISGAIEVYYIEKCPELDEGVFLNEECVLIVGIASILGQAIERTQAENELRRSEERNSIFLDALPDIIFIIGTDGIIKNVNRVDYGYRKEDVIGQNISMFVSSEYKGEFEDTFKKTFATGQLQTVETALDLPDGKHHYFNRLSPVSFDNDNDNDSIILISTDITDRKLIEQTIIESRRRLEFHLENTPIAVIEWNLNFEVKEWNRAAEKIFGFTKDEAFGCHAKDLILPKSVKKHVDLIWQDLLKQIGGSRSSNENITKEK